MLRKMLIPVALLMFALPAIGQTIGTIDVQKAMTSVNDGKAAQAKLEKKMKAKKAELDKKQKDLLAKKAALQQKMALMTPQEKNKKLQEYQQKVMSLQNEAMEAQKTLQRDEVSLTKPILLKLKKITAKIAKKHHMKIVVEKSATVFSAKSIDITNEVIRAYNK